MRILLQGYVNRGVGAWGRRQKVGQKSAMLQENLAQHFL